MNWDDIERMAGIIRATPINWARVDIQNASDLPGNRNEENRVLVNLDRHNIFSISSLLGLERANGGRAQRGRRRA